ncbi:T9SS type B sorting domain-containing protein [Gramella lutea]|uniref:T9SS type B sorting domain-containing protein n=1 Tax=Christiangramia lutea TaxID=1607951 RepID=A0A9X1V3A4_9FLAO|nr:T9SS type B sorting domain-containing protein [Christiangramia lutea]MCH4823055.1 T9SS type B sorting domain-containing protein [Christiangramia lutea]
MRFFLTLLFLFFFGTVYSQLGFCTGSKGDPIFHEDFGQGSGTGNELAAGITNYTFVRQDPQDGEYTISDDIGNEINSWHSFLPQNTVSGGRALIVNADFTSGRFYKKEISGLCENTTYEFSAFLMNVYDLASNVCIGREIPNNVRFEIWDETDTVLLKSGDTGDIFSSSTPEWEQFALTFQSQAGQSGVILKMFNNGEGGCGNDLAIDDIIFRSCGDLVVISSSEEETGSLSVCEENTPVSITLDATSDNSVYDQIFYQWQISLDGQNWGNIPGANSDVYTTSLIDETTYYRVKIAEDPVNLNNNFCSSSSEAFELKVIYTPEPPISSGDLAVCANEAAPVLRVSVKEGEFVNWYDQETGGNLLEENTNTYFPVEEGIFYAEARNFGYECEGSKRTQVKLTIYPLPDLSDEELKICPESNLVLEAGAGGYDYRWSTGESTETISINSPGNYSVEVISTEGCFTTKEINVIPVENASILDIISRGDDVEIISENQGDFLYSLDGENFQSSSIFRSVPGGIYTAYISDTENCKTDTLEFAHIVIPKMISPNNDGYNDSFQLKGVEFFSDSEIRIFDRYGKVIKVGQGTGFKWDGSYNGIDLPADDYWYHIQINGFEVQTGHFTLLR